MRAVAITEYGGRDKLRMMELPVPEPGDDEVLIQIAAAGVNPVDWKIREGLLKDRLPHEFPLIPGWDAAGVVAAKGRRVKRLSIGDDVYAYCRKPVVKEGTYAEFIVLPEEHVALKPATMSFAQAATVPLAALTAYQSLFDAAGLARGETVLIHAAAGGVGSFAIQLAEGAGARTVGTASALHHEYLLELGLDIHIDYTAGDFRQAVHTSCPEGVDVVFDCVGGDVLERSLDILVPGGRVVSIVDPGGIDAASRKGIRAAYVFVEPIRSQLEKLADMIDAGTFQTHIAGEFPLADAARAHELLESHHTAGKVVLRVR